MLDIPLEQVIAHEAAWCTMWASVEKNPAMWIVSSPDNPEWRDANRAMHIRDDGRGPETVAREVMARLGAVGVMRVADLDPVAEAQGVGDALRRLGMRPAEGGWLLMRYGSDTPPPGPEGDAPVEITSPVDVAGKQAWLQIALSDLDTAEDVPLYRQITELEMLDPRCRLYLGSLGSVPASTAELFSEDGWGRVDNVATLPALRRKGVAAAVVAHAVRDSISLGNRVTYLYTAAGGDAERIYRRLGFVDCGVDVMHRHTARGRA